MLSFFVKTLKSNSGSKPETCSINGEGIIFNEVAVPTAIECGCGNHHPVMGDRLKENFWINWKVKILDDSILSMLKEGENTYTSIVASVE